MIGSPAHAHLPSLWGRYLTAGFHVQAPLLRQTLSGYRCCGQTVQPTLVSGQPQVMVATLGVNGDAGGEGSEQAGVHDLASIISNLKTLRQVRQNLHGCRTPLHPQQPEQGCQGSWLFT